jgi:hypothetical protein
VAGARGRRFTNGRRCIACKKVLRVQHRFHCIGIIPGLFAYVWLRRGVRYAEDGVFMNDACQLLGLIERGERNISVAAKFSQEI